MLPFVSPFVFVCLCLLSLRPQNKSVYSHVTCWYLSIAVLSSSNHSRPIYGYVPLMAYCFLYSIFCYLGICNCLDYPRRSSKHVMVILETKNARILVVLATSLCSRLWRDAVWHVLNNGTPLFIARKPADLYNNAASGNTFHIFSLSLPVTTGFSLSLLLSPTLTVHVSRTIIIFFSIFLSSVAIENPENTERSQRRRRRPLHFISWSQFISHSTTESWINHNASSTRLYVSLSFSSPALNLNLLYFFKKH